RADQRAFLPPDLLDPDGAWIAYGEPNGVVAVGHTLAYRGRSAFLVLLNFAEGRDATLAYLRQHPQRSLNAIGSSLPQDAQVALVRQTLLIDDHGEIVPAPIIEQLQIRVYHDVEGPDGY